MRGGHGLDLCAGDPQGFTQFPRAADIEEGVQVLKQADIDLLVRALRHERLKNCVQVEDLHEFLKMQIAPVAWNLEWPTGEGHGRPTRVVSGSSVAPGLDAVTQKVPLMLVIPQTQPHLQRNLQPSDAFQQVMTNSCNGCVWRLY